MDCQRYRDWLDKQEIVLRQQHRAGEKLFVDHAGDTIPLSNQQTGEIVPAYLFVAVLGASNYTYAEATLHRDLPNWIGSHVRAFEFLGACPEIVVPDNWKTGVTCACRYEPELNQTYSEMAQHYGVAIIPARPSQTKRQGKSGTESFVGRTLDHCRPTPPDVLRARNSEPSHRRTAGSAESSALQET